MNKAEIHNLAKEAVSAYIDHEVPLFNSILKIAMDRQLSAQQVFVLSQFTNTVAHMNSFQKLANTGSADRYVTFDPVDPDKVIQSLGMPPRVGNDYSDRMPTAVNAYDKTASAQEPANVFRPGIVPDEMYNARHGTRTQDHDFTKVAAQLAGLDAEISRPDRMSAEDARYNLVKLAESVEDEVRIAYAGYDMLLEKIGAFLSRTDPSELDDTIGHLYNVDPDQAEKIGQVLRDLQLTPAGDRMYFQTQPFLEKHAAYVAGARWSLPLSALPIHDTVKQALDALHELHELGEAHTYLQSKLAP
jgi:hypothetical protein